MTETPLALWQQLREVWSLLWKLGGPAGVLIYKWNGQLDQKITAAKRSSWYAEYRFFQRERVAAKQSTVIGTVTTNPVGATTASTMHHATQTSDRTPKATAQLVTTESATQQFNSW